ncbi:MAG: DNA-binding protein, partial [Kiritimatiellae bacterium]|nr:DNA-binding protein [Kiritimatiellia bacterium]
MTASENQIVVYQPNETVRLDVRLENETVWLTQLKIAELFGVQKAAISKHVKNIFASGELVRDAT